MDHGIARMPIVNFTIKPTYARTVLPEHQLRHSNACGEKRVFRG